MGSGSSLDAEQLAVLELPGPERYRYFMTQVMSTGHLWIAESTENVLTLFDESENELLPVWPSPEFLAQTLTKEQQDEGFRPALRSVSQWEKKTTPALVREGVRVGVFRTSFSPVQSWIRASSFATCRLQARFCRESGIARIRRRVKKNKEDAEH